MNTWREDVIIGFRSLDGIGHLSEVYAEVAGMRPSPLPNSYEAIVRNTIECHSSDSANFSGEDLFYSVFGVGEGVWRLRLI